MHAAAVKPPNKKPNGMAEQTQAKAEQIPAPLAIMCLKDRR
jgi:hypothetical protein